MGSFSQMPGRNDRAGFTLIEVLIALLIAGLAAGSIYGVFISSNRSYRTQENVTDAQQRVRVGMEMMVRDIRMAGLDPAGGATDGIDGSGAGFKEATSTKIRFTADRDINGAIDDQGSSATKNQERITYLLESGSLKRILYEGHATGESTQTLFGNVSGLTFSYEDADGNSIAAPVSAANLGSIRTVIIGLTCQGTDAMGNTFSRTLRAKVSCRNLWL